MKRACLLAIVCLLLFPPKTTPHVDLMTRSTLLNIAEQLKDLERAIGAMDRRQQRQHRDVLKALVAIQGSIESVAMIQETVFQDSLRQHRDVMESLVVIRDSLRP